MIRDLSAAEFAAAQAEVLGMIGASGSAPRLANLDAATTAHDDGALALAPPTPLLLPFGTRHFRVPPLRYRDGVTLYFLDQHRRWCWRELKRLAQTGERVPGSEAAVAVARELFLATDELLRLFRTLVRPRHWWQRRPRGLFADATEGEIRALTDFFWRARMTSRVQARASSRAPRYLQRTWPPSSPTLPLAFRPGWSQRAAPVRASRAAGATTSSASPPWDDAGSWAP